MSLLVIELSGSEVKSEVIAFPGSRGGRKEGRTEIQSAEAAAAD